MVIGLVALNFVDEIMEIEVSQRSVTCQHEPTSHCTLLTTHQSPPTTNRPPSTVHHSSPTTHHPSTI